MVSLSLITIVRRKEKDLSVRFCHIRFRFTSLADLSHLDVFGILRLRF